VIAVIGLVSICIPAYKTRDLRLAIASALAQTYEDTEVIVSDDSPASAVADLCATFGGNVRYLKNWDRVGRGRGNIRNLIRESKGKYIKFLCDDDFLAPHCVKELVNLAEQTPSARLVASLRYYTDSEGNPQRVDNQLGISHNTTMMGKDLVRFVGTTLINPIGEITTPLLYRDDLFDASGEPWNFELDGTPFYGLGDVALWIKLAQLGSVKIHAEPLSFFRYGHDSNSSPDYNPEFIYLITDWFLVLRHIARCGLLGAEDLALGAARLRDLYQHWSDRFPQLGPLLAEALSSLRQEFNIVC